MIGPSDSNASVEPATDDASRSPSKFGATYIWGDSMTERPHNTHVRFYFQNCRIQATDAARVTMYKDMLSLNADVIGLAETHLNSRHTPTRTAIDDDFRRLWHSHKTTYSASNEHLASRSINGGTLQTTTGKLASRITAQGADDMGRFCWQRFHTSDTQQMTIITAYRVCQHSPDAAGETSAYMQQWRALQIIGDAHPNPRAAFLRDLALFIDTKQTEGDEILLQLDANTVSDNEEWSIFLAAHQLVDLHCIVSSDPFSQSFASGSTKIDYMLGTPKLATAVRAGGILNFEQGLTSDHRGMYLDLDETSLFSSKNADPTRPLARQLRLSNVQATKKYLDVLHEQLEKHNVFDRVTALPEQTISLSAACFERKYNSIDADISAACKYAESICTRKAFGFPFSIRLAKCGSDIAHLRKQIRFIYRGQSTLFNIVPTQIKSLNLDKTATLAYCYERLRILDQELKAIQAEAILYREECLSQLAQDHPHNAVSIETIKEREKLQRSFNKLRRYIKKDIPTGLDKLEMHVYDDDGNIISTDTLTSPDAINTALIAQQYKQFGQAKDTPCVASDIRNFLPPFDVPIEVADSILEGTFDLGSRVDEPMQAVHHFFEHLQRPDTSDGSKIDLTITTEDFKSGFKSVQERISSSPSGRHMGHYKAALKSPRLVEMYTTMMDLPMKHKFSPLRWQNAIQVLLEKDKGRPNIERLRTIQLVEADLNMVLRIIYGRRLVHHAEDHKLLPKSQFGSRPGVACISAVFIKTLTYDLLRQLRQDACVFNLDATGCYDRIIPSIGMLACMRLGLPHEAAITLLKILHGMKYQIRTALGITEAHFSNAVDWILGTLQGSGASPCIWLAISAVLIAALEQRSPGITFKTPDGQIVEARAADAFVDDTDLYISVDVPFAELASQAQTVAQHWEQLLYTSGGALNLSKCFWYGITWEWFDGIPSMKPSSESPAQIDLTAGHGTTTHTITRKECWEGMRTLGVRLSPLGNFLDEHAYRLQQFRGLALNIQSSPISRFDAYLGYVTILQRMLHYPLGATCWNSKQCRQIDASYTGAIISKMGFNRNTARSIIFGPIDQGGGMGHGDTETMQGQAHLDLFLSHLRAKDQTGNVLRISLETLNLFLGLPKYPLTYDYKIIQKYHEPIWLTNTWEFLSSINGVVLYTTDHTIKPQCIHDKFLMEEFRQIQGIGSAELKRLNQCRLYLQVTLLSEIASSDGKTITVNYISGTKSAHRRSNLTWPRQARPSLKAWQNWKKRLNQVFCTTAKGHRLRTPLRAWIATGPTYQRWDHYLDSHTATLYIKEATTPTYQLYTRQAGEMMYRPTEHTTSDIPHTALPVEIYRYQSLVQVTAQRTSQPPPPEPMVYESLALRLSNLPPHEQQLVGNHIAMPQCETTFLQDMIDGKVHSGTDGSVKILRSSHSWVLKSSRTGDFMASHAPTHPTKQIHSTKRPEAAGHAAALIVTRELLRGQPPIDKTMRFHVDNTAVVRGATKQNHRGPRATLVPEWDLMKQIHKLKQQIPIRTVTIWVKSHQDDSVPVESLSFAAQLNCQADALATSQHTCTQCTTAHTFHPPPEAEAYIVLSGQVVTAHLQRKVLATCRRTELRQTILKQTNWEPSWFDWLDWTALGRALRQVPRHLRVTTAKLQHNLLATSVYLHTHGNNKIDKRCFRCSNLKEDFDHVLCCPHGSLARPPLWDKFIAVLDTLKTAPYIKHKFLYGISQWQHAGQDSAWPSDIPTIHDAIGRATHIAYFEQEQLGWEQALRGRLSKKWGEAQNTYYTERYETSHMTGEAWTTKVITALWDYSLAIWQERNEAYHGADEHESRAKRSDDLNDLVVRSYSLDRYHPAVISTHLFKKPLEDILKTSDESRRSWLRSVDAALTGYRLRFPTDLTPRTSQQLWRGTIISTRLRCLRDNTLL